MSKKSTRQAYGEALVELGKINKDVVVLINKDKLIPREIS